MANLNDRISAMSDGKDLDAAFVRSSLEEEFMEHRLKLEASTKAEVSLIPLCFF